MNTVDVFLAGASEMLAFGGELARQVQAPCVVFLSGKLGAGKTTLVRGFLQALGYEGVVKSPTYTLVEPYELKVGAVYHFDLYRLNSPRELEACGMRDYFNEQAICIVEWPEKGKGFLGAPDIAVQIEFETLDGVTGRRVTIAR